MNTIFEEDTLASGELPPAETKYAVAALIRVEPELALIPARDVVNPPVDVKRAVMIGLGTAAGLTSMRAEILREFPAFPIGRLDKLQLYALAALAAHYLANPEPVAASRVQELVAEATPLREDLKMAATMLVHYGIFDAGRLAAVEGGTGHIDLGGDLIALGALFKENWAAIAEKSPVEESAVDRANELGIELLTALGVRFNPRGQPVTVAEAADRRARAVTLYFKSYDTCRGAIAHVRWAQGDVEQFMPSLFNRPPKRRVYETEEEPVEGTTVGTVPANDVTATSGAAASPAPATTAPATTATTAPATTATTAPATTATTANGPAPPAQEVVKAA